MSNIYFKIIFIVLIFINLVLLNYFLKQIDDYKKKKYISYLTDKWLDYIVKFRDPKSAANLFCRDGVLVATRSHQIRRGKSINEYFEWLSNIPNKVVNREYNISKITDNVYLNNSLVTWFNKNKKIFVVTRMLFIFRNDCLFFIHSSFLPDKNQDLYKNKFLNINKMT